MLIGKKKGFGLKYESPQPSFYLEKLIPHCPKLEWSKVTMSLMRDDIKEYNMSANLKKPKDPLMQLAIVIAKRKFELPSPVPILHICDVFKQDLPIWYSSPGLPWNEHGCIKKRDIQKNPDAISQIRYFWHRVKYESNIELPDCCAYVSSYFGERDEPKVKTVWCYPATITFGEAMLAIPLIRAYQKHRTPLPCWYETDVGGMKHIFQEFKGNSFVAIYFSKFDKSIPAWLISIVFKILTLNIDFTKYQDGGFPDASRIYRMFERIQDYFINTKIRLCNGERYLKKAGVPSGSYFAKLIESIANYILLRYAALKLNVKLRDILVFGDNSIMGTDQTITPDDISKVLSPLGITMNIKKSGFSKNISNLSFLGYKINADLPIKDSSEVIASLIWPMRHDRTWGDLATRAMVILYSNLGVDPIIENWCREIIKLEPSNLALTKKQDKLLRMLQKKLRGTEVPLMLDFMTKLKKILGK